MFRRFLSIKNSFYGGIFLSINSFYGGIFLSINSFYGGIAANVPYDGAKKSASSYQKAFKKAMADQDLRRWIRAPPEVDSFQYNEQNYAIFQDIYAQAQPHYYAETIIENYLKKMLFLNEKSIGTKCHVESMLVREKFLTYNNSFTIFFMAKILYLTIEIYIQSTKIIITLT